MKKILFTLGIFILFIVPIKAIDKDKISIYVNSTKLKLAKSESYIEITPDAKDATITAFAEDGVKISGTGLIKLNDKTTTTKVIFEKGEEKLEYVVNIIKNFDKINLSQVTVNIDDHKYYFDNYSITYRSYFKKNVYINATTTQDNVEISGNGKLKLKGLYTNTYITLKNNNSEEKYIVTIIKMEYILIALAVFLILVWVTIFFILKIVISLIMKVLKK